MAADGSRPRAKRSRARKNIIPATTVAVVESEDAGSTDGKAPGMPDRGKLEGAAGEHPDTKVRPEQRLVFKASGAGPEEREFLVKWKEMSYLHCCWIREQDMRVMAKKLPAVVGTRLRRFLEAEDAARRVRLVAFTTLDFWNLQCSIVALHCAWF